jgi:Zn-dependent protease
MENAIQIIFQLAVIIFSVVIHEVSHGYAALMLGDHTAEQEGRLTLNPVKHIDPFGSIILPLILSLVPGGIIFGWAKPVPYNPYNLRNQKWGPAIVGVAGPLANLAIALIFGIMLRFLPFVSASFGGLYALNFLHVASMIAFLNTMLAIFNLVPIPPLDGSKVLFSLLPYQLRWIEEFMERYSLILFLLFIFVFADAIIPVVLFFFRLFSGMFPVF